MNLDKYTYLDSKIKSHINELTENDETFSETKFDKWLEENKVSKKDNPSAYLYKHFEPEYRLGTFTNKKVVVSTIQLQLRLDNKRFTYKNYEPFLLELVCSHILNEFPVKPNELQDTINKILDYIEQKSIDKTYHNIIDLLLKSKLKANVPINELTVKATKMACEWADMMKKLGNGNHEMTIEDVLNYGEEPKGGEKDEV